MTADILMSIRPKFADAILAGEKSHELRRRFSAAAPGARVFIYASSPVCQLVGTFSIGAVDTMPTWVVARRRRRATTLTAAEIQEYLHGIQRGTLIEVADPVRFITPIDLARLREWGVEPPQSYRFLPSNVVRSIERAVAPIGQPSREPIEWHFVGSALNGLASPAG